MAILDPYAALGVTRTATREEIARAHRRLVKRSHPDTGARTSPSEMARITEAWRILGDPLRRARWDREHAIPTEPPPWSAPLVTPDAVHPRQTDAPPSRMDSGWIVAAVVIGMSVVVGGLMVAVMLVAGPTSARTPFSDELVAFEYPDSWTLTAGEPSDTERRVLAHLTSFGTAADERCLIPTERCRWEGESLPSGGASVQVLAWESVAPPEPNPPQDARSFIGGEPAAHAQTTIGGELLSAWWQLSPPGFPDRWIEIRAEVRGGDLERSRRMAEIDVLLNSLEFAESS